MKDLHDFSNIKFYRISIAFIIATMISGIVVVFFRGSDFSIGFYIHLALVVVLANLLWFYPKRETTIMKTCIIILAMIYFYALFFLYPETSSAFVLLCLSPGIAILFFSPRIFYISLFSNIVSLCGIITYIYLIDKGAYYPYLYQDLGGNLLNFLASQVTIYLIFYLTHSRIKNQQLYYEQVQQAERLKTTGQLAAAVAHEIRNPITVVKGFLQFYKDDPLLKEKKEHFILMLDELNIAENVISDFLSIAKVKDEQETPLLNVRQGLQSVVDLIYSFALINNIMVRIDIVDDFLISFNLVEFKQLLTNLLKNAIEASPSGSTIMVHAQKRNHHVEITVEDSGTGMTKEELKGIGTPFYSLKSKGTGLGLMVCFNIVDKNNGTIKYESEKGKGTKVILCFPVNKPPLR